jgi:hypothetical protein
MDITPKIKEVVEMFYDAFGRLTPDEKVYFLVELDKKIKGLPESEKKLYLTLLKCAREGKSTQEVVKEIMEA